MKHQAKKDTRGFTIIEVMIVLAIAGLIMAIIFLAVPALRRNSTNNSRRNDAAHFAGLVNEYAANHAGALPTTVGTGATDLNITGENWAIMNAPTNGSLNPAPANTWGSTTVMNLNRGYSCNSSTNVLTAASARTFSVTYQVDSGGAGGTQNVCIQG